jgi:hypothetical protein
MKFTNVNLTLSKYKFDMRTFLSPVIFIKFRDFYIEYDAKAIFRETL